MEPPHGSLIILASNGKAPVSQESDFGLGDRHDFAHNFRAPNTMNSTNCQL
jgi:hypothetical protein